MKMLNVLLTTLLLSWAARAEDATSSCLEKATLEKLGFTAADVEKVSSPTYCTDVYADPGRCIAADTIKTFIDGKQDQFSTYNSGYGKLTEMFDTFFGNIGESLSNIWSSITDSKKDKSWKEQMAEAVSKAKENHDKCFKTHNQIMHGVSCLLSSAAASQKVTVDGSTLTIKISESALQVVSDCMTVVSAICMYYRGGEEAKLDIPQSDEQKALCEQHQVYEKCLADGGTETTCLDNDKKKPFFEKLYAPYKNMWMPAVTDIEKFTDKMSEWFSNAKDTVFSWFKSDDSSSASRILESDMTIKFTVEEGGHDCYGGGEKSGVEVKGIKLFSAGIVVSLISLILRIN